MKEKRERLAEAKRDLELAEHLCQQATVDEATCAAEIDEETQPLRTANFRPCEVQLTFHASMLPMLWAYLGPEHSRFFSDTIVPLVQLL